MPIAPSHDEEAKGMLGEPLREALQLRLDLLDAINPSPEFDSAAIADAKRTWQEISVPFQSEKGIDDSNEGLAIDSDNGESDLRKTWERQWTQIMESEAGSETSQRLPPWRRDMMAWLEGALGHESLPHPLLQRCLSSLSERLSMDNRSLDPGRAAVSETIAGLSRALVDMAETPSSVVEGYQLLEAIWLMNVWIQDEAWMEVTLDQVLMELDPWPELVEAVLPQMRVDWAQARVDLDEEWTRGGLCLWATPWMLSKKRSTTHRVTMLWSTMHERPSRKQAAEAFIWAGSKTDLKLAPCPKEPDLFTRKANKV